MLLNTFIYLIAFLIVPILSSSSSNETQSDATTIVPPPQDSVENEHLDGIEALPLKGGPRRYREGSSVIRSRREPPFGVIRHRKRPVKRRPKPRNRSKGPKPKYGPPGHSHSPPISFYKPYRDGSEYSFSDPSYKLSNSFEELSSNTFDLSSDLSLHNIAGSALDVDNSFSDAGLNFYDNQPITFELAEKFNNYDDAHKNYAPENPKETISSSYLPVGNIPHTDYGPPVPQSPSYEDFSYHQYQSIDVSNIKPSHPKGKHRKQQNFAEPPPIYNLQEENPRNILSKNAETSITYPIEGEYDAKYHYDTTTDGNQQKSGVGYFAEPPPSQPQPSSPQYHSENSGGWDPVPSANLPLENDDKRLYESPKSSYEVPLYDPVPFTTTSTSTHEFYPPELPNTYKINEFAAIPKDSNSIASHQQYPTDQGTQANNHNLQTLSASLEILHDPPAGFLDELIVTSTKRPKSRNRTRFNTLAAKTHNLDTDELNKAYISSSTSQTKQELPTTTPRARFTRRDNRGESSTPSNFVLLSSQNEDASSISTRLRKGNWEPTKARKYNTRSLTTTSTTSPTVAQDNADVDNFSIQKSLSHSYYAGTIPPEMIQNHRTVYRRKHDFKASTGA